jgi:hypothetical protein
MKTVLPTLLYLSLFFSCTNDMQKNKSHQTEENISISEKMIIALSITSKNPDLTLKQGTDISMNEMITKNLVAQDKILFKDFQFTLENPIKDAFNFYSDKGRLMCEAPTDLSVMSMPPDGTGPIIYMKGDNIEFMGTSLIKINDIKFVISNIQYNSK